MPRVTKVKVKSEESVSEKVDVTVTEALEIHHGEFEVKGGQVVPKADNRGVVMR